MKKRVLITGGAGFIGSHLADELLKHGYAVRALDCLSPQVHGPAADRPDYLDEDVELLVGDVRSRTALRKALRGVDMVVHFAARVGVGQSMYEVADYTEVNNVGTAVLLEELMRKPVERLIVASSMSIYGEGMYQTLAGLTMPGLERPLEQLRAKQWELRSPDGDILEPIATPETKQPSLASVYALSKFDQERMCLLIGRAYQIPTVALRFFNVYGPRQALSNPYTGVLAIFAARLLNDRAPLVFEDGYQQRDFVSVYDVAQLARPRLGIVRGRLPGVQCGERRALHHPRNCGADGADAEQGLYPTRDHGELSHGGHPALLRRHHARAVGARVQAADQPDRRFAGACVLAGRPGGGGQCRHRPGGIGSPRINCMTKRHRHRPQSGSSDGARKTRVARLPAAGARPKPGADPQVLITGGAGFIGTNVAHHYLAAGQPVRIYDNLSRPGVERNWRGSRQQHGKRLQVELGDLQDFAHLRKAVRGVRQVFHFAAQVAVTTSLDRPLHDFEVNARGTLNLLEAIRELADPPSLVFTSTNKVYGALDNVPLRSTATRYEPQDEALRSHGFDECVRWISTVPMGARRARRSSTCWITRGPFRSRRWCSG